MSSSVLTSTPTLLLTCRQVYSKTKALFYNFCIFDFSACMLLVLEKMPYGLDKDCENPMPEESRSFRSIILSEEAHKDITYNVMVSGNTTKSLKESGYFDSLTQVCIETYRPTNFGSISVDEEVEFHASTNENDMEIIYIDQRREFWHRSTRIYASDAQKRDIFGD